MSTEEKMTIDERRKYLRKMQARYRQAGRKERGHLLDEMEAVTELHRKSLLRLMQGRLERMPRQQQRGRTYTPQADDALRVIAESFDYICPERLTPNLPWMAQHLATHGELSLDPPLLDELDQISVSTVRRILSRLGQDQPRLPRPGPQQTRHLTRTIPMRRIPWNQSQPGYFEADLVYHSGPDPSGQYVHTLQMVDVATGWSERRAVLGRSYLVMRDAFLVILTRLPFPVREIHTDNGSEFLNAHLLAFWTDQMPGLTLSRSRPFHKNDNPFVEQKNGSLIRAYVGHDRLDTVAHTLALNLLYDQMGCYYNLFQPVMRVAEKIALPSEDGQPTRIKRRYDRSRTPLDRLCQTDALNDNERQRLRLLRERTNPRSLRTEIYRSLEELFRLPNAVEGITENVHDTLTFPLNL